MGVERRPIHHGIAGSAGPGGVSAAVAEAGLMPDQNFAGAEHMPVGAPRRWAGDPLPARGLHQLAQHVSELRTVARRPADSRCKKAKNALRLILCFRGYEYCKSRLRLLPSSPARQVEAVSGVHGGRAGRNSLPASAVTLYT